MIPVVNPGKRQSNQQVTFVDAERDALFDQRLIMLELLSVDEIGRLDEGRFEANEFEREDSAGIAFAAHDVIALVRGIANDQPLQIRPVKLFDGSNVDHRRFFRSTRQ